MLEWTENKTTVYLFVFSIYVRKRANGYDIFLVKKGEKAIGFKGNEGVGRDSSVTSRLRSHTCARLTAVVANQQSTAYTACVILVCCLDLSQPLTLALVTRPKDRATRTRALPLL
ncbi:hypothetical protein KQX54_019128 [Cotesia glomerata]|uniref:Uncharacterized protein n=1 Tax=Cotesia glomerata TaxID=32391 RepID=A0AAV7HLI0_COTGL|nr:hypothetical protein KQX54_019128 [Cotesia glomerata]